MPPAKTYKATGIVLRKTKLGEKDLIVTLITQAGDLVKVVAKGARKPGGSFASKLELFAEVDFMAAHGRTLDVITDARFSQGVPRPDFDLEQTACASVIADLLSYACQEGLEQPRIYDMSREALRVIALSQPADALAITAAALVKLVSALGFRPYIDTCCSCFEPVDFEAQHARILFSAEGGGVVCPSCERDAEGFYVEARTLIWTRTLLLARFANMFELHVPPEASLSVLQLMQSWISSHLGKNMKSLAYIFTCGLF